MSGRVEKFKLVTNIIIMVKSPQGGRYALSVSGNVPPQGVSDPRCSTTFHCSPLRAADIRKQIKTFAETFCRVVSLTGHVNVHLRLSSLNYRQF